MEMGAGVVGEEKGDGGAGVVSGSSGGVDSPFLDPPVTVVGVDMGTVSSSFSAF